MKVYTFGKKENSAVMLLPGTCCHWKSFEGVIPKLSGNFYGLCVSYDSFDETGQLSAAGRGNQSEYEFIIFGSRAYRWFIMLCGRCAFRFEGQRKSKTRHLKKY